MNELRWERRGSMTWQKEIEIPPKPGLQFGSPLPLPFHIYPELRFHYQIKPHLSLSLHSSIVITRRGMKGGRTRTETKKADAKLSVKKGAAKAPAKKGKPEKDPNKPKRPASAFFVFMEDFRTTYKEKHPHNKSVAAVGKAGGDKWKSLTEAEKAPYISKAEKRKADYEKTLAAYNKRISEGAGAEEESDKSKSEVNDDDNESSDDDDEDDEEDEE